MGGDEESPPPSLAAPDSGLDQKDGFQETQQNGSDAEGSDEHSQPETGAARNSQRGPTLRQPAPLRPESTSSPTLAPGPKHHHQRSRSVNLSPVMPAGSFLPPPQPAASSPVGAVNLSLNWASTGASSGSSGQNASGGSTSSDNGHLDVKKVRAASPLSFGGPLKAPSNRLTPEPPTSSSALYGSSPTSSTSFEPFARSPDNARRTLHFPSDKMSAHPGWHAANGNAEGGSSAAGSSAGSSRNRNASPARVYAMPMSPRLQAFGSNRLRRSSSSSSNGARSGGFAMDRGSQSGSQSPPNRACSPVAGPINPDPEHAFDSIWPTESGSPSSSPQRTRGEALTSWGLERRGGSRSPLPSSKRSSALFGTSPLASRGGSPSLGARTSHRRSLSHTSSSPPSNGIPMSNSLLNRRGSTPDGFGDRRPLQSTSRPDATAARNNQTSLMAGIISPTTSSIKLDAQSVLAGSAADGTSDQQQQKTTNGNSLGRPSSDRESSMRADDWPTTSSSGLSSGYSGSPFSSGSPFARSSEQSSPASNGGGPSESPPKTRSFIGMPPRSGYELSDDPDDVGSEDGTSSSVSSGGGVGTTDDEDEEDDKTGHRNSGRETQMDEDETRHDRHEIEDTADSEELREHEAFAADEEDVHADQRRQQESSDQDSTQLPPVGSAARPHLPKRPSLTRSSVVPSPVPPEVPPVAPSPASNAAIDPLQYFSEPSQPTEGSMWLTGNADDPDSSDSLLDDVAFAEHGTSDDVQDSGDGSPTAEQAATEDNLSTLERIFLLAKSEMTYHRVMVSHSMPTWLCEVELSEAVEYVVALLNGLATDEVEVCTAFASELHRIMWFFYLNCPLAELNDGEGRDSQSAVETEASDATAATRPRIPVGIFTPLICALLLNQSASVASMAQSSLVHFFLKLKGRVVPGEDEMFSKEQLVQQRAGREGQMTAYDFYEFDEEAKRAVANELLDNVAFAIGRNVHEEASLNDKSKLQDAEAAPSEPGNTGQADNDASSDDRGSPDVFDDVEADSSWDDTEMQESQHASWRPASSPFESSSPVASAYGQEEDIDEEAAVGRMTSISLLGALAQAEGAVESSTVEVRFVPEVVALKADKAFYVRKEAAVALGPMCQHLEQPIISQHILPVFRDFCEDEIWHVRQAACSSLPAVFKKVVGSEPKETIVSLMRSFSTDVSRNVRTTALEIIGEVIFLFDGHKEGVPEELIRFFLGEPIDDADSKSKSGSQRDPTEDSQSQEENTPSQNGNFLFSDFGFGAAMANGNGHGQNSAAAAAAAAWSTDFDPERPLVMAYNFPAVVLTLGGQTHWSRLRQMHAELSQDSSVKVRQSLAASLFEIAKLVGAEAARDDLLPIFERFTDPGEEGDVKAAALDNVAVLLQHMPQEDALSQLGRLAQLWSTSFSTDWRLREALALGIPHLAELFVLEDEEGALMSLMQAAIGDPVSAVREAGVKAVPALYQCFAARDQTVADGVLGMLTDLGEAPGYRLRVGCLLAIRALCEAGYVQRSSFQLIILPRLVAMASDEVVDVRMALANVVKTMCQAEELYGSAQSRSPELLELLQSLVRDSSEYVRARVRPVFEDDDPALQATPRGAPTEMRRDLVLGPADGSAHRLPPPFKDDELGGLAEETSSTAQYLGMVNFGRINDEDMKAFDMDEDQIDHDRYSHANVARDQDDDDDLEMISLDTGSDAIESTDSSMADDRAEVNRRTAEDSFASSEGDEAGSDAGFLFLTSPEKTRSGSGDGSELRLPQAGVQAQTGAQQDTSDSQGGNGSDEQPTARPNDPFLSFVGSNLGDSSGTSKSRTAQ